MSTRRQAGFSLVEILVAILILGILSAIAIPSFRSPSKTAKAEAMQVKIDAAAIKMTNWATQTNGDDKFGAGASLNQFSTLTPAIAGQVATDVTWSSNPYPTDGNSLYAGACTPTNSSITAAQITAGDNSCGVINGCLPFFKGNGNLCLSYEIWPRGTAAKPGLKYRKVVTCNNGADCTNNIYSAATNGLTSGTLSTKRTITDNNPWPQVPSPGITN